MAKIDSPIKVAQSWQAIQARFRQGLSEIGASQTMQDVIMERMKTHYLKLGSLFVGDEGLRQTFTIPLHAAPQEQADDISAGVSQAISSSVSGLTAVALMELLDVEIQLYFAQHPAE